LTNLCARLEVVGYHCWYGFYLFSRGAAFFCGCDVRRHDFAAEWMRLVWRGGHASFISAHANIAARARAGHARRKAD